MTASIRFGWSQVTTFNDVVIHRTEVPFTAPVLRITSQPANRIALYDGQPRPHGSWMHGVLNVAAAPPSTLAEIRT